jgi:ABC-type sugar transport system ATPase subunit
VPFLEFRSISKRFPGVRALDRVSFSVERGSCHALIGENGAGKSTLGRILAGIDRADEGDILLDGRPVLLADPPHARSLGIAMVHQELAFCPNLTVAENLSLGAPPARWGWVDRAALRARAAAMLAEMEADIDPDAIVGTLSTGREQVVQIAAAVGTGARILVMDEPTSSLSAGETHELYLLIGQLKARGITLIYISHRMEELFDLCDAVTVLRDGRHVATEPIAATTPHRVVTQMIGRELEETVAAHFGRPLGAERLRVEGLTSPGRCEGVSFGVRAGEIVGIAGLVGAGRSETLQAVFGLDPHATGRITVDGGEVALGSVSAALDSGLGLLPEDRKRQGLVLAMNSRENISLAALPAVTRAGWIRRGSERELAARYSSRLRVKAPSLEDPVSGLSGGNQQKIALAKWLARSCEVLLVDEPTRGVDVGAKAEIHRLLDELACDGRALLVVSSELPELIALCGRILVMRAGRIVAEVQRPDFTEAVLMRAMTGVEEASGSDI